MNARLRKEFLQLRPAWIAALVLALIPISWMPGFGGEAADKIVLYVLGLAFLGVASFGREFVHGTFHLLLIQPCKRSEIWREKLLALGVATISVWLVYWISNTYFAGFSGWGGAFGLAAAVAVVGTGLWTSLLFRQTVPAFCFTLLLPSLFVPIAAPWMDVALPTWKILLALGTIFAYGGATLAFGAWTFGRAQDRQSENWMLMLPAGKESGRTTLRRRGPTLSLLLKELRLQQVNIVCGLITFVLLGLLVIIFEATGRSKALAGTETAVAVAVTLFPLLVGAVAIAEERKLGTEAGQFGLPVSRRRQFFVKAIVFLGCAWILGAALPVAAIFFDSVGKLVFFSFYALFIGSVALYASSLSKTTPAALLGAVIALVLFGVPVIVLIFTDSDSALMVLPVAITAAFLFLAYWTYVDGNLMGARIKLRSIAVTSVRGILVMAVGLAAVWLALDGIGSLMVRRSVRAWEEAGLPLQISEIAPPPASREGNAALIVEKLTPPKYSSSEDGSKVLTDSKVKQIRVLGDSLAKQLTDNEVLPETVEKLAKAMRNPVVGEWVSVGREAAQYPHFDAYFDYDLGFDLILDHVVVLQHLSQLLKAKAILQAAQGRWLEAHETLIACLQMGEFLQNEPFFISLAIRMGNRLIVFEGLESLLQAQDSVDPEILQLWVPALSKLESIDFPGTVRFALIGAAVAFLEMQESGEFRSSDINSDKKLAFFDHPFFRPLHKADVATCFRASQRVIALLDRTATGEISWETLEKLHEEWEENLPWYAVTTKGVIWRNHWVRDTRMVHIRLILAQTALAIHRYRHAKGDWPETLADLVPEYLSAVPQDSYGEASLRYLREPGRVLLYSLGPNETDDSGNLPKQSVAEVVEMDDIVWVLEEE